MYRVNRHQKTNQIDLQEFTGGLNYLLPADLLQPNECVIMDNLSFDPSSGILSTRPGFRKTADLVNVRGAFFTADRFFIVAGNTLHVQTSQNDLVPVGTITGNAAIVRFAEWDDGILIAAGGPLWQYKGALTSIDAKNVEGVSINADHVFVRAGRAVLARTGLDTLHYSGVADPTDWTYGEDASKAKYIEIGFRDGGDIAAIVNLSQDVVIFKTNGNIYRLLGEFPEWQCVEVARGLACLKGAAMSLLNNVIFLSTQGLMALETVQQYGAVQVRDGIGTKVNSELMKMIAAQTATLSYSPTMGAVFMSVTAHKDLYVMSATYGAFTRWQLPFFPVSCGELGGSIWFAGTDGLYIADFNSDEDIADVAGTEKTRLVSHFRTKTFRNPHEWLLKRLRVGAKPLNKGIATITIDRLVQNIETGKDRHMAYEDDAMAYYDNEPLVDTEWNEFKFYDVWRGVDLIVDVEGDGRICVKMYLDVAQVG